MTLMQMVFTHLCLASVAILTRSAAIVLRPVGLASVVAPSNPDTKPAVLITFRGLNPILVLTRLVRRASRPLTGAGGGSIFELNAKLAGQCLPLAIVYLCKVLFSNLSFA